MIADAYITSLNTSQRSLFILTEEIFHDEWQQYALYTALSNHRNIIIIKKASVDFNQLIGMILAPLHLPDTSYTTPTPPTPPTPPQHHYTYTTPTPPVTTAPPRNHYTYTTPTPLPYPDTNTTTPTPARHGYTTRHRCTTPAPLHL